MLHPFIKPLLFCLLWPFVHTRPQPSSTLLPTSTVPEPSPTPTPAVNEPNQNKYFHEPGGHEPGEDDRLGHYDSRYFHGLVSLDERTRTLTHMVRAYLATFQKFGLKTWIAHGTLLGWWWNGKVCKQYIGCLNFQLIQSKDSPMGLGRRYPSVQGNSRIPGRASEPDNPRVPIRRQEVPAHIPSRCESLVKTARPWGWCKHHRCTMDRYDKWSLH